MAFALRAPPSSLAAPARRRGSNRPSVLVRVAEFERKTASGKKVASPTPPAVDGETPLDILNDGGDAFAELVAMNRPKQSVNRPQKVRSGAFVVGWGRERRTETRRKSRRDFEWLGARMACRRRSELGLTFFSRLGIPNAIQEVNFRQNPTFEDCYPSSTKEYKEVVHEATGTTLRVRTRFCWLPTLFFCSSGMERARREIGMPELPSGPSRAFRRAPFGADASSMSQEARGVRESYSEVESRRDRRALFL